MTYAFAGSAFAVALRESSGEYLTVPYGESGSPVWLYFIVGIGLTSMPILAFEASLVELQTPLWGARTCFWRLVSFCAIYFGTLLFSLGLHASTTVQTVAVWNCALAIMFASTLGLKSLVAQVAVAVFLIYCTAQPWGPAALAELSNPMLLLGGLIAVIATAFYYMWKRR